MKNNQRHNDMPVGKLHSVDDFLPPPHRLVIPEETIKVTIALNKSSVNYFKQQADRYKTKYQKMIRTVVDQYANHYAGR